MLPSLVFAFRRNICFRALFLLVLLAIPAPFTYAQSGGDLGTGGRHTIQGRIYFPSGRRTDGRIKVTLQSLKGSAPSVFSDGNGSFTFRRLEPGSYTVVVDGGNDYETASESVYIETDGSRSRRGIPVLPVARLYNVQIDLRLKSGNASKAGVLNAALAHVPEPARELYHRALESARAGDSNKAVAQLRSAVAVYPQFPMALNQLGVQYLLLGQADKAAAALQATVALVPEDFEPRLNYGIALLNLRKLAEAELQLRVAVRKNNWVATPHLYLGITLAIQRKLDEAEKELRTALSINGTEMGPAHRYLGAIYMERREYKRAADELDTYLKLVPIAADAEVTRQKIRELRGKS